MSKAHVIATQQADENNVVHSIVGGKGAYCRAPCKECPWRVENTGNFPADAFLLSAHTAYDRASEMFACHMVGYEEPATCAGFLLRGADDNMAVRIKRMKGQMCDVSENGSVLHESYFEMAVANGCDPDDDVLAACMPEARNR